MTTLVDPTAAIAAVHALAPRPAQSDGRVGLVDAMLSPRAGWGRAMLDAASGGLGEHPLALERRTVLGVHDPTGWAKAMADLYRALVIATGD